MRRSIIPKSREATLTGGAKRARTGFTLIELMIVVAVLSIMLAVGVPAIRAIVNRAGAQYAADELYSILMEAKIRAVRSNTNCSVTFNMPPANSYNRICLDEVARGEAGETVWLGKYRGNVQFTVSPNAVDAGPTGMITFGPQGFPPDGGPFGSVYIQEADNNIFYRVRTLAAGATDVDRYARATGRWE